MEDNRKSSVETEMENYLKSELGGGEAVTVVPDIVQNLTTNTTASCGAREDLKCDSNSLPAYVVSSGGGGTAEVPHKVDPRHSIIPSAFKWKFHKF